MQTTNSTTDNTVYTLSIQVSLNGLSFCTVNEELQISALEHENFGVQLSPEQVLSKIKYYFDHNEHLKQNFSAVEVIYQNDLYTFVPKALFDEQLLKEYLKYNIKVLENDFITYDILERHDLVTVYVPYANINNFFFETFGTFTYKHSATVLIDNLLAQQKNTEKATVFVNMYAQSFDLVVIEKGKLVLSNTYKCETKEDFLYYLLFTAEQLELNPEEFTLVFLGDIAEDSDYYKLGYQYVRHIVFGNHTQHKEFLPDVKAYEPHQHFVLLSHF
ncbi:DUF3822 family protein [Aquimarina sp. 2201CG5-10]|uniref:DUF3822 family protein n=1 Tax=Aquimarina callyspongiae TaxID=3098150 RepID=UPI002AC9A799|nr:DUF3822 family protein [Aquimarina sp. 2201CG5-10]